MRKDRRENTRDTAETMKGVSDDNTNKNENPPHVEGARNAAMSQSDTEDVPLVSDANGDNDGVEGEKKEINCKNIREEKKKKKTPLYTKLFGVRTKRMCNSSTIDICDMAKFLNCSWWFWVTPWCRSTVMARRGFHLSVLSYLVVLNLIFWNEWADTVVPGFYELFDDDNRQSSQRIQSMATRLMVFVVSGYIFRIADTFYVGSKKKAGVLVGSIATVVDDLVTAINYDHPRAQEVLQQLHGAITLISHYTFAMATKNYPKLKLSKEDMAALFEERRFDSKVFLPIEKKTVLRILNVAILQTVNRERARGGTNGCMGPLSDFGWEKLKTDVGAMNLAAASVTTSTNSNKYPFALYHLVQWMTRIVLFFLLAIVYGRDASEMRANPHSIGGVIVPFSCFWGTIDPELPGETYCPTLAYIHTNVFYALTIYFVLGCLEIQYVCSRVWENGLNKDRYLEKIDLICEFLDPSKNTGIGSVPYDLFDLTHSKSQAKMTA